MVLDLRKELIPKESEAVKVTNARIAYVGELLHRMSQTAPLSAQEESVLQLLQDASQGE